VKEGLIGGVLVFRFSTETLIKAKQEAAQSIAELKRSSLSWMVVTVITIIGVFVYRRSAPDYSTARATRGRRFRRTTRLARMPNNSNPPFRFLRLAKVTAFSAMSWPS
jgi:hypothetical protein